MDIRIAEIIENYGCDIEIRDDYSGRGMFGRTTVAVVCSFPDFIYALKNACLSVEEGDEDYELLRSFNVSNLSMDSMGYESVFY
jgi:hypothetical protein